jgi:polar amino acid transport system substrate-binding protein
VNRRSPTAAIDRRGLAGTTGRRWLAVAIGALLLVAGCAGCGGEPTGAAAVVTSPPRIPAGLETLTGVPAPPDTSCGDATESLRPTGPLPAPGQMPAGSTMAKIKDRGRLIAGVDQNAYLFGYRDPISGELTGFDIDIAREIALAIFGDASKIEFHPMTAAQRIPALKNNEVDVVVRTFTVNCERRKEIQFSSVYYQSAQRVLVRRGSSLNGLADLGEKRVCAAKGSTSIQRIASAESKPVPIQVNAALDCLMLLQLGKVDAISTDDVVLHGFAAQDPGTEVVGPAVGADPYGIGIPKANEDMVRFVNGVLERLRSDGTWTAFYEKNLSSVLGQPPAPPEPLYQQD